jgi:type IV pilus assembly protein PilY1
MKAFRTPRLSTPALRSAAIGLSLLAVGGWLMRTAFAAGPSVAVSQVPLQLAVPARPQVLIAIGNSESMDGTLSGAIMAGSGSVSGGTSSLTASSSPTSYVVPAGFAPPVQAADAFGNAPYTVTVGGDLVDNGASRLNVAKAGVQAILQSYIQNTDFALVDYNIPGGNLSSWATWVYYMSPLGQNFGFTNTQLAGNRYVANPCQGYLTASATVNSNCSSIAAVGFVSATTLSGSAYMQIGATSDDPVVNDVLYSPPGLPGVFLNYGALSVPTPYPPSFSLANYNSGSIFLSYASTAPAGAPSGVGPTNAGYVPYSMQVMYSQRGFGYYDYNSQSPNSGNIAVPLTSSGNSPTTASITTALNAFQALLQPETNNAGTSEIKAAAVQAPLAGLLTQANTYLTGSSVPHGGACPPTQYVILISDGLPTQDLAGQNWPPLGSAAATGYGVSATFNADGSLNTTNDQALTDTINSLATLRAAGIQTYIVGLGAGVNPLINPQAAATLQAMAIAGGTGSYFPASSPAALVTDLNTILLSVQSGSYSTTSAAVNSSRLSTGSVEYQATFTSATPPSLDWTGDVVEMALDPSTGAATGSRIWDAQALLDGVSPTSRVIATWNPTLGAAVPFEWNSGISANQQTLLQPSDTLGQLRLAYLRGDTSQELRNGGAFRNRSHLLGDIVDSQPAYVGAPNGPYFTSSYFAFQATYATRQKMLYTGANDGMLHAFNATTGVEQFAFIPNGVFANLYKLSAPLYNQNHQFYVDGSPQAGDVMFTDGTWHTLLVGGENAGGQSVYAIDVTRPATLTTESTVASAVKWEYSDAAGMGLSYSQPVIAQIAAAPGFAIFFGNGYNSSVNHAILYAVNPQTGATVAKIDLCAAIAGACNSAAANGLSSVTVANADGLLSAPITQVYAGDLQGNLWAVDVSSTNPASWAVRLLFQARDGSGNVQPITTAPVVTLNPNYPTQIGSFVMFGTGQFLAATDLTNAQTQTAYGVWDKPGATGLPFHRSNLQAQTLAFVSAATSGLPQSILTDTSIAVNFATQVGWYDDLPTAGQRFITNPQLLNGALLATLNTPPTAACGTPSAPMLLELNYATGGAPKTPLLDINGDGAITTNDTYLGTNPVGIGLGGLTGSYASSPTIVVPPCVAGSANCTIKKVITLSNGSQQVVNNPNGGSRTTAWTQLQ